MAGNFVGRRELLRRVLAADVEQGRRGRLFVVQGIPGSGKTEFLLQLRRNLDKPDGGGGAVIAISCADYEVPGSGRGTRTLDDVAESRQFTTMLRRCLPDTVDGAMTDTVNFAEARPAFGRSAHTRNMTSADPGQLVDMAAEAITTLARDLAEQEERVLVLVDDFHLLASRPLGDWVLRLLVGTKHADIVVTQQPTPAEHAPPWPSHAIVLPLRSLGRDDVQRYLAASNHIGPDVAAATIEPVWEFTLGNPQAMVLVADLLRQSEHPGDAVQAIRQIGAIDGEFAERLEELVERVFRATGSPELRHALYSLCVTRYFDTNLMTRLLGVDQARAEALADQMRQFSFVTDSANKDFLTISPYVRHLGETKHTDRMRRAEIHEAAAEYFHGLIRHEIEDDQSWTDAWRHLEDARFQTLKREWLYHVSRLTGPRRKTGRLEIARLFLDAFWWWGSYVPFPFCEELLADWVSATSDGSQESKEDREWGRALRAVYRDFPKGNRLERATRPQLVSVRRHLRQLWDRGALGSQQDNAEARHVRGIVDVFMADILRSLNPADPHVDEALDDAAALLAEDDEYFVAWIDFQRDDLLLQRSQWQEAMSLAREAAKRHAKFDDHELTANFHRVHADALWARGHRAQALDGYARAVLHAYASQVDNNVDPYTIAFQREMIDRSMERMAALYATADGSDETRAVLHAGCARIRSFFGAYWQGVGEDETLDVTADVERALAEGMSMEAACLLFPALAPEVDTDLTRVGTEWELICHDVLHEMLHELEALPGTPLRSTGLVDQA